MEATVETEQTLTDGNRIVHHQIVHVYRDSDGRTRRGGNSGCNRSMGRVQGTPPTVVTIQDPVSGVTYSLDPQNKVATKLPTGLAGKIATSRVSHANGSGIAISASPDGPQTTIGVGGMFMVQQGIASPALRPDETSESLGKETIAGVSAEGVRTTMTIPAQVMGNERPIEIARERWFSPELQIVLRSKQSDPRFGVTTSEVMRLDRANSTHSLFEIPRDYQIRKAPEPPKPPAP